MMNKLQSAHHYLNQVDKLEKEGMYNQSQTELYIAVSYAGYFYPALRVRFSSERFSKLWVVSVEGPYGVEVLLRTPVLTEVTKYIRNVLPKEGSDEESYC